MSVYLLKTVSNLLKLSFVCSRSAAVDLYISKLVSSGVDVSKRLSEGFCIVTGFKGIVKEKHPHPHSGTSKPNLSLSSDRLKCGDTFWKSVWVCGYCFCLEEECRGLHFCRRSQFSCFSHKETFKNKLFGSLLGRPAICRHTRPDASKALGNQTDIPQ